MTVGETIRTIRKEKGMTLKQIAEKIHMTETTVHTYETGKRKIDVDTRKKIAGVLEVPEYLLFPEIDWEKPDIATFTSKELIEELMNRVENTGKL